MSKVGYQRFAEMVSSATGLLVTAGTGMGKTQSHVETSAKFKPRSRQPVKGDRLAYTMNKP